MLIALAVLAVLLALPWLLRPAFNSWGATESELAKTLPGDELNPAPISTFTHAITIDAPPEKVWPWVVQIGMERGGWYTYDWFYDLTGSGGFVDGHSSDRIVPELQGLKVGRRHQDASGRAVQGRCARARASDGAEGRRAGGAVVGVVPGAAARGQDHACWNASVRAGSRASRRRSAASTSSTRADGSSAASTCGV